MTKILAIDLGKFKSVTCLLDTETNDGLVFDGRSGNASNGDAMIASQVNGEIIHGDAFPADLIDALAGHGHRLQSQVVSGGSVLFWIRHRNVAFVMNFMAQPMQLVVQAGVA